jgi:putative FmdB family regulatory protein
MPIYAYKCESCGHAKDMLQKISDAPLRDCPACGQPSFVKQLTAAGFQLKGSGWYVTDFRGGSNATATSPSTGDQADTKPAETTSTSSTATATATASASSGESSAIGGCGASCACH